MGCPFFFFFFFFGLSERASLRRERESLRAFVDRKKELVDLSRSEEEDEELAPETE